MLGGGNSNNVYVHPDPWGEMIQFDDCAYFNWVGLRLGKALVTTGTEPRGKHGKLYGLYNDV